MTRLVKCLFHLTRIYSCRMKPVWIIERCEGEILKLRDISEACVGV